MRIDYKFEGKLENGRYLFQCEASEQEIDINKYQKIVEICHEWKIEFVELILYFIENLTTEQVERIIDEMDLSGIRKLFEGEKTSDST